MNLRKSKTISIFLVMTLCMATVLIFQPATARAGLSSNPRRSAVLECFKALRPSHDGSSNKFINGNAVSDWNYLYDDYSAYITVKNFSVYKPCYASDWAFTNEGCYYGHPESSFYSDPWNYGYGYFGGTANPVGRGGQCKFFANLVLYKSGSHTAAFPSYADMWSNGETNLNTVKEGDVIIKYTGTSSGNHTAIVVEIKRNYYGQITGLDVIDSNYISDIGTTRNREVIGRHLFQIWDINNIYRIWKGTEYYGTNYNPNA